MKGVGCDMGRRRTEITGDTMEAIELGEGEGTNLEQSCSAEELELLNALND